MRKILLFKITILSFLTIKNFGQEFLGYRTLSYGGINSVFFNPANIADSRHQWDLNLLSLGVFIGNNQSTIKNGLSALEIDDQFYNNSEKLSTGMVSLNLLGPSLMFGTGKKSAIAITSRIRTMVNLEDIDGGVFTSIFEDFTSENVEFPLNINAQSNNRFSINGWTEIGFTYSRVLVDDNEHFFKGGLSLKYLNGLANAYVAIGGLKGKIFDDQNQGYYITDASGRLSIGLAGIDINNFSDFDIYNPSFLNNYGFGGDLGFVYEYRPNYSKFKKDGNEYRRDVNKYKLRIGFSIMDIGSISYPSYVNQQLNYKIGIKSNQRFYLDNFDEFDYDAITTVIENNPQFFTKQGNVQNLQIYKVNLPSTVHLDIDYNPAGVLYLNAAVQVGSPSSSNLSSSKYYSMFSFTPRIEGRLLALCLPLSLNEITGFNSGVSLRIGSLFIGTGSGITALFSQSKQADIHLGLRIGSLQRREPKAPNVKYEYPLPTSRN